MRVFLGKPINPYIDPWYRFDRVISVLNRYNTITSEANILDLGCQLGQFISRVKTHHDIDATGIDDYAPERVQEISETYFHTTVKPGDVFDGSWEYIFRDIATQGIALDEKFDLVSALEILEHMTDTDAFLHDIYCHIRPRGYLIISTPNINSLRNRIRVPLGYYPAAMEYRNVIHHVRLYNAKVLTRHLKYHGFDTIQIVGVNLLPARFLPSSKIRSIDQLLASWLPQFCGNLIGLFQKS